MHHSRRARIRGALLLVALVGTGACTASSRTEIVLGLATDLAAPNPLATVDLEVRRLPDDLTIGAANLPISGRAGEDYELPRRYAVHSRDGSADRFRVILSARDGNGERLIVRTAVMTLVPERSLFVRLGMVSACLGRLDCATGATCIDGSCASEEIDAMRLPPYVAGLEKQASCAGPATYINTGTQEPLPVVEPACPAGRICAEGVCLLAPADDAGSGG